MRLFALLGVLAACSPGRASRSIPLCELPHCACTPAAHPSWTTVNCTILNNEKLDIFEGDLPAATTDILIYGAEAVMFGTHSLSRLMDLRHIRISNSKVIVMRHFAALNLNVVNLYLQIDNCDVLRFEERTFSSIKGPLSVAIRDCEVVSVEGAAFSWLLNFNIANAHQLELGPEVFNLDPTAANVGEHGPGMTIELQNLTVPEFASLSFGSSAAAITMNSVEVRAIRANAFRANTYNVITAINSSFLLIEEEAFVQKSFIDKLHIEGCRLQVLATKALQSAITSLNIINSTFNTIETGAVNTTVANVIITDNEFKNFMEGGFELSSWNKLVMKGNSFDDLPPNAIVAPGVSIHELVFTENEIESAHPKSLSFIGQAILDPSVNLEYENNYFGQPCYCNISSWLSEVLAVPYMSFLEESYCTVDEFFARCFNVPDQNMVVEKFVDGVCTEKPTIKCESTNITNTTIIKNPRFPHKKEEAGGLTGRNKKIIGIVIVTCLGCIVLALLFSLIKWMRQRGYCLKIKDFIVSANSSCGFCGKFCACGTNRGVDNARSISQLSVNEYSERHRLNEPRVHEVIQETAIPEMYSGHTDPSEERMINAEENTILNEEQKVPTEDKTTQTLPEELTKELLENLKEKLEDPENYVEAREMIEHLYELIKVEENCNNYHSPQQNFDENIYELPFQNTAPRIGKNKKQMKSVGTRTPSLDKLVNLSPYNRQTALAHEYFEPKDFAVHLYAEIANCNKEKKSLMSPMPDVVTSQLVPSHSPYLAATKSSLPKNSIGTSSKAHGPRHSSSLNSNQSKKIKMVNRPLPDKPTQDPGQGASHKREK